jgi:hypothetical protein
MEISGVKEVGSEGGPQPLNPRDKILIIEDEMRKQPQVDIPPMHYFAKGIYAREILIPKGTLLTGMIHRTEHLSIISKGDITIINENGERMRIRAPYTVVSQPGTKRLGYAHEDTVWTTIHGTEERDLDALEKQLIAPSFEELASKGDTPLKNEAKRGVSPQPEKIEGVRQPMIEKEDQTCLG